MCPHWHWTPTAISSWSALGTGVGADRYPEVNALQFDSTGNLFVGGSFDSAGGLTAKNIARWDGSAWSSLGQGRDGTVNDLAVDSSGALYAVGCCSWAESDLASWDGNTWSDQENGLSGVFYSIAIDSNDNIYMGGNSLSIDYVDVNNVAMWNGNGWITLDTGVGDGGYFDGIIQDMAVGSNGALYVTGEFDTAGGLGASNIAQWDGASWSALDLGLTGGQYTGGEALTFGSNGILYAGG